MSVPNQGIGWSNESKLLQFITKQLERLTAITGKSNPDYQTVTTTYVVINPFTGASPGDIVTSSNIINANVIPPVFMGTVWINQTTGLELASTPDPADISILGSTGLTNAELRATPVDANLTGTSATDINDIKTNTHDVVTELTAVTSNDRVKSSLIVGQDGVDGNSGNKSDKTVRVVLATDQPQLSNKLLVTEDNSSAIKASVEIMDDWDESDRAKVNPIVGHAGVSANSGTLDAGVQRVTIATDDGVATNISTVAGWNESARSKVNIIAGQAGISAGAGAVAANTPRVTLASDDPSVALLKTIPYVYGEAYVSPQDFSVAYTSNVTLTVTGAPFDIDDANCYVAIIDYKNVGGTWTKLVNAHNSVSITSSSNVITVAGAGTPFTNTDLQYRVVVLCQKKAFDSTTNSNIVAEISPLNAKYVQNSIVDTTNTSAATTYYPSSTGMSMDGYRDMSVTGKFITTGTLTFTVECSNDEDTTNADWLQVFGFDTKNNVVMNSWSVTNGTLTFSIDFDNFNYSNFRFKVVDSSSTNTYIIKARQKAI